MDAIAIAGLVVSALSLAATIVLGLPGFVLNREVRRSAATDRRRRAAPAGGRHRRR